MNKPHARELARPLVLAGKHIRAGRALLNWSVLDLAVATGMTAGVIRRIETANGKIVSEDDELKQIVSVFSGKGVEFDMTPSGVAAVRPLDA